MKKYVFQFFSSFLLFKKNYRTKSDFVLKFLFETNLKKCFFHKKSKIHTNICNISKNELLTPFECRYENMFFYCTKCRSDGIDFVDLLSNSEEFSSRRCLVGIEMNNMGPACNSRERTYSMKCPPPLEPSKSYVDGASSIQTRKSTSISSQESTTSRRRTTITQRLPMRKESTGDRKARIKQEKQEKADKINGFSKISTLHK